LCSVALGELFVGLRRLKVIRKLSFAGEISQFSFRYTIEYKQGDQKVSVHLQITIKKSGAKRLFGHPV
jgi:hypothetical protein